MTILEAGVNSNELGEDTDGRGRVQSNNMQGEHVLFHAYLQTTLLNSNKRLRSFNLANLSNQQLQFDRGFDQLRIPSSQFKFQPC